MNTSNSKKTRLNKEFCIKVLTSTSLILLKPCKSSLGPSIIIFILQLYVYDFAGDKNWDR